MTATSAPTSLRTAAMAAAERDADNIEATAVKRLVLALNHVLGEAGITLDETDVSLEGYARPRVAAAIVDGLRFVMVGEYPRASRQCPTCGTWAEPLPAGDLASIGRLYTLTLPCKRCPQ